MPTPNPAGSDIEPVPFIDLVAQYQTIRDEVRQTVDNVFETQRFVLGEEVEQLESEIASYCDAQFAIGCASGTDALVLSLLGLGAVAPESFMAHGFRYR